MDNSTIEDVAMERIGLIGRFQNVVSVELLINGDFVGLKR